MRNGKEGVSYRLVFLNGNTAVKTVNFVDGVASDSTAFSTEGNYTIALVAGIAVLQQYASVRVGEPTPDAPTISGVTPFADTTTVTIAAEAGATIKYTTDGSTPSSSNGQTYSSPFTISQSTFVQAVAILGTKTSTVASKSFVKEEVPYTITSSINNNPGNSQIIMTVDGQTVASGGSVLAGKTVHVEITNATENWEAFTVNNQTKITTLSGTSRVVDFVMPSANAGCVASFTAPQPISDFSNVMLNDSSWNGNKTATHGSNTVTATYNGSDDADQFGFVKAANEPTVGSRANFTGNTNSRNINITATLSAGTYWLVAAKWDSGSEEAYVRQVFDYNVVVS